MKLKITLSLIVIALFFNNVYANSSDTLACNQALDKGDITTALTQASRALSANENDKDALICQGRAQAAKGDMTNALVSFKLANAQSIDVFDKTISTLLLGNAYKSLKHYDEAIASYQQTILNAKAANNLSFERLGHNAVGDVYFEENQLKSLDSSLFSGLDQLFLLRLDANQLTSIDAVIFSKNKQMWTLMLDNNRLEIIDQNVFVGMDDLEKVYLGSNPISTKQPDYVKSLCSTNPKCKIIL